MNSVDRNISDIVLIVDDIPENLSLLHDALDEAGYTVLVATNGESALQRARQSLPDVILLDALMPGIDGWETIRRIRQQHLTDAQLAILSANAFDKGLDNDVGIAPEDFIVKPLKVNELLDWLGRKLGLEWVTADTPPPAPVPAEPLPLVAPAAEYVAALEEAINLGYLRGILNQLAEIEKLDARHGEFVRVLRELARQFQFDAMKEILRKSAHEPR